MIEAVPYIWHVESISQEHNCGETTNDSCESHRDGEEISNFVQYSSLLNRQVCKLHTVVDLRRKAGSSYHLWCMEVPDPVARQGAEEALFRAVWNWLGTS